MKLSQLIPAGDYLSYKGDWVTNTVYNVNECVTWTDGHLYQVIKAHTSSDTLVPSNTEYYKAMTATKYITVTSDVDSLGRFSEEVKAVLQNKAIYGARIKLRASNNDYFFTYVATDNIYIGLIGGDGNGLGSDLSARIYLSTISTQAGKIQDNRMMVVTFKDTTIKTNVLNPTKITVEYLQ